MHEMFYISVVVCKVEQQRRVYSRNSVNANSPAQTIKCVAIKTLSGKKNICNLKQGLQTEDKKLHQNIFIIYYIVNLISYCHISSFRKKKMRMENSMRGNKVNLELAN